MTDHSTDSVTDTVMRERDYALASVKNRLAAFCKHFAVDPPKLKVRKGSIHLTDELIAWCSTHGASLDWLLWGDALGMASAYREKHAQDRRSLGALKVLDDTEKKMLADALAAWKAAVEARRAQEQVSVKKDAA